MRMHVCGRRCLCSNWEPKNDFGKLCVQWAAKRSEQQTVVPVSVTNLQCSLSSVSIPSLKAFQWPDCSHIELIILPKPPAPRDRKQRLSGPEKRHSQPQSCGVAAVNETGQECAMCRCQYAHGYEELRKPNPGGSVPGAMGDRGGDRGPSGPPFPPGMMVRDPIACACLPDAQSKIGCMETSYLGLAASRIAWCEDGGLINMCH